MRIRTFKTALEAASRGQGASHGQPREAKIIKNLCKNQCFLAFFYFCFQRAFEASRWPQDGPREPQDGPKRGPRRAQERPRSPQERPKRAPRGDFSGPDGGTLIGARRCFARLPPRWPQDTSQTPPKSPTKAPRPPKRAPKMPQESPKRAPFAFPPPSLGMRIALHSHVRALACMHARTHTRTHALT